jgi:two-component system sensor histidine kinase QseC
MQEIRNSAAEMQQIVESLLALTRYEAGLEDPRIEPVELCDQLRQQPAAMNSAADQRALEIELDLPDEAGINTDSALVRRLVGNLLGNQIARAPASSNVRVRLDKGGATADLKPRASARCHGYPAAQ